jgi:uncharacterized protein (DUF1800 family)
MAFDPKTQAATALHRFGFAPKAGMRSVFLADPRSALTADLDKASCGQIVNDDLLSSGEAARAAFDFRQERKGARLAQRVAQEQARAAQAEAKNNPSKTTNTTDLSRGGRCSL